MNKLINGVPHIFDFNRWRWIPIDQHVAEARYNQTYLDDLRARMT